MTSQMDITNLPDGSSYDSFMSRAPSGVQIGDDSQFINPYAVPTETSPTSTVTTPKNSTSAVSTYSYTPPSSVDPYWSNMPEGASYSTLNSNGNASQVVVKSGSNLSDVWITNFIKSVNWKSKAQGFWLNGPNGYAEFSNVYVSGNVHSLTGSIGGFVIDATTIHSISNNIIIDSSVDAIWVGDLAGKGVALNGNGGDIVFYDQTHTLTGEIYGSDPFNHQLVVNAASRLDLSIANVGYLSFNPPSNLGSIECEVDFHPGTSTQSMGTFPLPWHAIIAQTLYANQLGDAFNKVSMYGTVTACPLPTFEDALSVIRKIPDPVRLETRGHFGDRFYIDDLTFPDEALHEINGKKEIELTNMTGLLVQAVRELTDKVDKLENQANKGGFLRRLYRLMV